MSEITDRSSSNDNVKVEYVNPTFTLHKFSAVISERKVMYQVVKMVDSLFIFINDKDNMDLSNLFVALIYRNDNQPISTRLLGDFMEEVSKGIALRLAKKLNKTVYVSCNLEVDRTLLPLIEKSVYEEVKARPEMF